MRGSYTKYKRLMGRKLVVLAILAILFWVSNQALAQNQAYQIRSWFASNGSTTSQGGSYILEGSAGVAVGGQMVGANLALRNMWLLAPKQTPPPGAGDGYEMDDDCTFARQISTNGISQRHTLHDIGDTDWIYFRATHAGSYQILVDIPFGSPADVDFAYYTNCENPFEDQWKETYAPGVQLTIEADAGETFYMELKNFDAAIVGDHVAYDLSVQALSEESATGAVILVAGRLRVRDPVQENIHNVTQQMLELFQGKGVESDDIILLSTDSSMEYYYADANLKNLEDAIVNWAAERVSVDQALTLYIMTHGEPDELYIDKVHNQTLTPALLDSWLTALEEKVPGVKSNIIIEACHSGSFIEPPQSISAQNRLIMTSTDPDFDAFASRFGAHFTDNLIVKLGQGENLKDSFKAAVNIVDQLYKSQDPWLDVNGDGTPNEVADKALAAVRGFRYVGSLGESWPPFIAQASPPSIIDDRRGRIYADVRDDTQVESVWAVVYPPDYVPPAADGEINPEVQDIVVLQRIEGDHKNGGYYGDYTDFDQAGTYQIVVQARDRDGLVAQPQILEVDVEVGGQALDKYQLYLPTIRR